MPLGTPVTPGYYLAMPNAPCLRVVSQLFLLLLLGACSADVSAPPPTGICASVADCASGSLCVDAHCVAPADAGPGLIDGGPVDGSQTLPDFGSDDAGMCSTSVEAMGATVRRPIDVIVLPDESASMGGARDAVANAMETVFRTTMESAGIDYHVIWHGSWPLPMLAGHLTYNALALGSGDSAMFTPVLDSYDAWSSAVRPEAIKVFVHFTDATSGTGATITGYTGTFDEVLVARDPALWGTAAAPLFTYNAFIGLTENVPPEMPYLPSDPLVVGSCSDEIFINSSALQEMAQRTGGLRFPLCRDDLFSAVFQRIAESAVARATVPCELILPAPPVGTTIDESTVAVRYRTGAGGEEVFLRSASAAECTDTGFLLAGDHVTLCPAACARVEADDTATLSVLSGCDPLLY